MSRHFQARGRGAWNLENLERDLRGLTLGFVSNTLHIASPVGNREAQFSSLGNFRRMRKSTHPS